MDEQWTERVEAALEKVESWIEANNVGLDWSTLLPLARALWSWEENYGYIREDILPDEERGQPHPALRAFVEDVEAR